MKTQKTISFKTVTTLILLSTLFCFTACSNTGDKSAKEKPSATQEIPEPPALDIHGAALMGDVDAIRQHIEAGTDLNTKEPSVGSSPLITAAVFNKPEVAKLLCEAGADINFQNNEGSTALHSAAFLCRTEIVKTLLDNGADKTLRNNYGSTALESVAGPFSDVKAIYDIFNRDLGPLGFKVDYKYLEETRPVIADMLK